MGDQQDEISKQYNFYRGYTADTMRLVDHAVDKIGDLREIEISLQSDDRNVKVRIKSW